MEEWKYVKTVDDFGRITIPREFRDLLKISSGSEMMVLRLSEQLILRKVSEKEACALCGDDVGLHKMNNKYICDRCIGRIKRARPAHKE